MHCQSCMAYLYFTDEQSGKMPMDIKLLDSGVASYGALGHVSPSTSNNFIFSSLWSKSESQLSKYCVVCEFSWCRCQQLTPLSIGTALVTKLLVIKQLLHPAPKSTVSAPWHNFHLCPFSQQILVTPLLLDAAELLPNLIYVCRRDKLPKIYKNAKWTCIIFCC